MFYRRGFRPGDGSRIDESMDDSIVGDSSAFLSGLQLLGKFDVRVMDFR